MSAFIDITPPISAETPVFPGDTPFEAERTWKINEDGPVNVSKLTMSTHAGAHADAPLHYDANGASIDAVGIEPYIGPCAVIHQIDKGALLTADMIAKALGETVKDIPARLLIRTYERQPESWDPAFTVIAADAIRWLAEKNVKLIGVDTPSLDPAMSKIMDAHRAVFEANMRILEGLLLDDVRPGVYELIAPPLKLVGLDAAPLRALLRTL